MTHLEFECSDEKALFILKAARLYDEGLRDIPEWISCDERLPEDGVYLVSCSDDSFPVKMMRLKTDITENVRLWYEWTGIYDERIFAWQPLPKPYEEDNYESNNSSI